MGSGTVVIGATGGCGVTTIASCLALVLAQEGTPPFAMGADSHGAGPAGPWGIPIERSADDLVAVAHEMTSAHVASIVHAHASGVRVIAGPSSVQAAARWSDEAASGFIDLVTAEGPWVADAGRGGTAMARAAIGRASCVVLVAPRSVDGARRGRSLIADLHAMSMVVAAASLPAGDDMSGRALARALGAEAVVDIPVDARAAAHLAAGRLPSRRRRGLVAAVAAIAQVGR